MNRLLWLIAVLVFVTPWASLEAEPGQDLSKRQVAPFPIIVDPPQAVGQEGTRWEVLRGDFHMHTTHSDGKLSPVDRVVERWSHGYDVIAITDHGNFRAYEEARRQAEALGMILLRGMETGVAKKEHLVVLDFGPEYQPRNPHQLAEEENQPTAYYRDEIQQLHQMGAYILYAHPHVGLREPVLWAIGQGMLKGIELKNGVVGEGWNTVQSHGTWWYPFALDWALEHNLAVFANSDIHGAKSEGEQPVTLLLVNERSPKGVRDALDAGRTIASFDGMLCAREELLTLFLRNLVHVQVAGDSESGCRLCIANRSPLTLTALLPGIREEPLTLAPFEAILLPVNNLPESVTIEWTNVWVRSDKTLTLVYPTGQK